MRFSILGLMLLWGICSFAQSEMVTANYGNLNIEWDESLQKLMAKKENAYCPPPPTTIKEFCQGARVQVFYSKDRNEAEQKLNEVKSLFPQFRSNVEYISPDYKVFMGYFRSREAAQSTLTQARRRFTSSLIVDQVIRCSLLE